MIDSIGTEKKAERKNPGWRYIILLLLGVSLVSAIPYLIASQDARRVQYEAVRTALPLPTGTTLADLKQGSVYQVEDADTLEVVIDGKVWPVRLSGIDTPLRNDKCFRDSADRTMTLAGSKVFMLQDTPNQDASGRLQRYVFLADGTSISATLVAEGFATAWDAPGPYRDQLVALQAEAQAAGRGCLWRTG